MTDNKVSITIYSTFYKSRINCCIQQGLHKYFIFALNNESLLNQILYISAYLFYWLIC